MNSRVNNIKQTGHPCSEEIYISITWINRIFNFLISAVSFVGAFVSITAADSLSEWATDYKEDVVEYLVDYFGYAIELESDTFAGSPVALFLHVAIIFTFIVLALVCVKRIVTTHLQAKIYMMDSLYRSEKLNELLVENIENELKESQ